ncbi:FAD-dependent oxidoreductase [Acrocarpospora phusangensis]|uniref:FAD-dependent oxidoreductase n=1 Tax=Acrocarpospora phusangensis TaxID=1070424 RepID=A0A919UKH2_9ACTN|nr:NAD(P)-binding domain-containing protein [Acrocarpospora phusangensis]GIH25024.1 FAD-dependent oxidoreductase [Acrocarpospora phusangensis]
MTARRAATRVDTVVVGAGHAGLAVSRLLSEAGRDHVVVERGRVGHSWRTQRWDSLRLLTPAWLTRLPGYRHGWPDEDAYPAAADVVACLARYAALSSAPVHEQTTVLSVRPGGDRWLVVCDNAEWNARHVVIASGHSTRPVPPAFAARAALGVQQLNPLVYRSPSAVAPGRVLVVGASASGVQIADELAAAGREVTLAVGRHRRVPRRYRGRDILWWLDRAGQLDRAIEQMPDPAAARNEPSLQLTGCLGGRAVDLAALAERGIRLTGRVLDVDGATVHLAADLPATVADADRRMHRLLHRLDAFAASPEMARLDALAAGSGVDRRDAFEAGIGSAERPPPVPLPARPPGRLDLRAEGFGAIVWATGFRGDYTYLHVPGLVRGGQLRQHRGATPAPGLFVIGQRFARSRRSGFIDGARLDAAEIVAAVVGQPLAVG